MGRLKKVSGRKIVLCAVFFCAFATSAGTLARVAAAADTPPVQLAYAVPGPAAGTSSAPIARTLFRAVDTDLFPKWHSAITRTDAQLRGAMPTSISAAEAVKVRDVFDRMVAQAAAQSGFNMLVTVNELINAVPYRTDQEVYGVSDYWATPVEMLAAGGGDCEDHAIAKLAVLRQAGISSDKLRLVVGIDTTTGKPHAMAAAEVDGVTYALDGRTNRVLEWNNTDLRFKPLYAAGFHKAWIYRS